MVCICNVISVQRNSLELARFRRSLQVLNAQLCTYTGVQHDQREGKSFVELVWSTRFFNSNYISAIAC